MDQLAALGLAEARSSPDLALQESGIREFVDLRAERDADTALNMLSQSQGGEPEDWRTWLMQNLTKVLAHPALPGPWRERLQFHFEELHNGGPQLALQASPGDQETATPTRGSPDDPRRPSTPGVSQSFLSFPPPPVPGFIIELRA